MSSARGWLTAGSNNLQDILQTIIFVRAGQKPQQHIGRLLATAWNWQLKVDLGKQLKFPDIITETSLRSDMVLVSEITGQVVLLELTVPPGRLSGGGF